MIEMDTVYARWLKFVRPLDTRHFNFMRPTLEFHAPWTPRSHYFLVHTQNFGVRDAGTHLNGIAAWLHCGVRTLLVRLLNVMTYGITIVCFVVLVANNSMNCRDI
jgi:hypothetical protein